MNASVANLVTAPVVVVSRKASPLRAEPTYELLSDEGMPLGAISPIRNGVLGAAARAIAGARGRPVSFELRDPDGTVLAAIEQPRSLLGGEGSRLEIVSHSGAPIGEIKQGTFLGRSALTISAAGTELAGVTFGRELREDSGGLFGGRRVRTVSGKAARRHRIVDGHDNVLAEIEGRDERNVGFRERLSTDASYVLRRPEPLPEPLATLTVVAAVALDRRERRLDDRAGRTTRRSSTSRSASSSAKRAKSSSTRGKAKGSVGASRKAKGSAGASRKRR